MGVKNMQYINIYKVYKMYYLWFKKDRQNICLFFKKKQKEGKPKINKAGY